MTLQAKLCWVLGIVMFSLPTAAQPDGPDASLHKSEFITANGVRLHYLEWGGKGETMLFLLSFQR
jgi:hypothetical protein